MATNARRATAADNRPRTGWRKFIYTGGSLDTFFIMTLLLLLAIGLICLFSASYVYADYYDGDSYFYIKKQALFAVIGLVAMFGVSCIDYHVLHKFTWIVMGISLFLLVLVLFLPAPTGIHRWINLPLVGGFQPSELAKFAIILSFAHLISINHKQMKKFTVGYVPFVLILGVTAVLIIAEPHLSGTILVVAIGGIMMFVGGTRVGYLAATVGLAVGAVVLMVGVLGYEADRIMVWQDPIAVYNSGAEGRDLAWQTVQSLYAIGSGGLMGLGLGNSREKHLFLPEPQNDFIFSIVCEELGFVGAAIINQTQVDVYADGCWQQDAPAEEVMVLHTLVISPKQAGKGFGKTFVHFYEQYALENGCRFLRMDTNVKNVHARKIYAKLGYREAGVVPCIFNGIEGVQLVLLEKKL